MRVASIAAIVFVVCTPFGSAAEYYVNNVTGNDANDGLAAETGKAGSGPTRTTRVVTKKVIAGDTIHLAPTGYPYRETIQFTNTSGKPREPITVDGHGAWITGADHVHPEGWRVFDEGRPGTLMRDDLVQGGPQFGFCIDREMTWGVRSMDVLEPGEFCVVKTGKVVTIYFNPPDLKRLKALKIEVGQPDGVTFEPDATKWTRSHSKNKRVRRNRSAKHPPEWVKVNGEDAPLITPEKRLEPGQWCRVGKSIYYRTPEGKDIADLDILAVPRACGVSLRGNSAHLVFKNLNAVYVCNDGYNIHGKVKDAKFYNCNAYYCYDEGFSSHDTCETLLDGATYVHCDNGINNVNKSTSVTRNVILAEARAVGYFIRTEGASSPHLAENMVLVDNPNQFDVRETKADNVLIVGRATGDTHSNGMSLGHAATVTHATITGNRCALRLDAGSNAEIVNSFFGPGQKGIQARVDDPAQVVTFTQVHFAPGLVMEWNSKPHWQSMPIGEWVAHSGETARMCKVTGLAVQAALGEGNIPEKIPEGVGCTRELYERYVKFMAEREALLEKAREMAWKELPLAEK